METSLFPLGSKLHLCPPARSATGQALLLKVAGEVTEGERHSVHDRHWEQVSNQAMSTNKAKIFEQRHPVHASTECHKVNTDLALGISNVLSASVDIQTGHWAHLLYSMP